MNSHILVGFSTKEGDWLSALIRFFSGHWHSHCVLVSPDRKMIAESTAFPFPDPLDGEMRDGVRVVPIEYLHRKDAVEIRKIEHPYPELVWEHADKLAREKVKYDHKRIRDWLFRMSDGDEKKVSCEELILICAARGGHALLPADVRFPTPRDLYLLSKEI